MYHDFLCQDTVLNLLLQIESLSVTFHGHDLIVDSELELNYGRFVITFSVTILFGHMVMRVFSPHFLSDDMVYLG